MADTTISPNMNIPVPVPSTTPGPDWANDIVADMYVIDSHDHTAGKGVPITPDGLDISADLSMGSNNLTEVRSVNFDAQSSPLSDPSDLGCLYVSGADLYYNDEAGNQVRITQSGSVTGSSGTITGLPSGTASASFSAGTFTFQSATSTPANFAIGPVAIGRNVASSKTVTLTPNAGQAANYGISFPAALPGATNYTTLDASGNLSFNSSGVTGTGAVVQATSPAITSPTISNPTITGVELLANGALGTPSLAFASDTDLGIYRKAANVMMLTSNSVDALQVDDGQTSILDGTITAPSLAFISDPNTGIYTNAADTFRVVAGGLFGLQVKSTEVAFGSGTSSSPSVVFLDDADTGFYSSSANVLGIAAGGTAAATVSATAAAFTGSLQIASGGAFKVKIVSLGTSSATSGSVSAAHGLTLSSIISITGGYYDSTAGTFFSTGYDSVHYAIGNATTTNVLINFGGASANSKAFTAVITYQ